MTKARLRHCWSLFSSEVSVHMPAAPAPRQTPPTATAPALLLLLPQFASRAALQGRHQRAGTVIPETLFTLKLSLNENAFLLLLLLFFQRHRFPTQPEQAAKLQQAQEDPGQGTGAAGPTRWPDFHHHHPNEPLRLTRGLRKQGGVSKLPGAEQNKFLALTVTSPPSVPLPKS